ncbi:hypothetical protein LPJ66_004940 [Kickxella alabastrina]|uniref:Uncharacterized protein n=1 Tax=Kickxella alabastrina TaxID=61397 RepID=A0ACC1IJZ5_9FUNG|nr:hypothetical protein LPJ66_004940 [Kickxella alabastrina]
MVDTPADTLCEQQALSATFPPQFLEFLQSNHINPNIYTMHKKLPRYVRIVQYAQRTSEEIQKLRLEVEADAGCRVSKVPGVPGFLEISDQSVSMSQINASACGDIVGMDVSSAIAALALSVSPGDNVLDLCCAPGAKLLFLAELLDASGACESKRGSVTGVDIAAHRVATCCKQIAKHAGHSRGHVRVFIEDGTTFSTLAPRDRWWDPNAVAAAAAVVANADGEAENSGRKPKSRRKKVVEPGKPWFASRPLSNWYSNSGTELYDRVLVDAECTHDGSLSHVQKYERWGLEKLETQVIGDNRPTSVPVLQSKLLENGWRLLKVGGTLVYSTCSLSRYQNEYVVAGFLSRHGEDEACVEKINVLDDIQCKGSITADDGSVAGGIVASSIWMPQTDVEWSEQGLSDKRSLFERMHNAARLDPMMSNTSGMFIARMHKLKHSPQQPLEDEIVPLVALPLSARVHAHAHN